MRWAEAKKDRGLQRCTLCALGQGAGRTTVLYQVLETAGHGYKFPMRKRKMLSSILTQTLA